MQIFIWCRGFWRLRYAPGAFLALFTALEKKPRVAKELLCGDPQPSWSCSLCWSLLTAGEALPCSVGFLYEFWFLCMYIVSQPKNGSQMEIPICIPFMWFCCNGFIHPTKWFLLTNQCWASLIQFEQAAGILHWFPSLLGNNETLILNYQPGSAFSSAQLCWCCSSTSALPASKRREHFVMWGESSSVCPPQLAESPWQLMLVLSVLSLLCTVISIPTGNGRGLQPRPCSPAGF